ncbi:hypothetical protein Lalb_Chr20g0112931 [Lupinus albus]|uniref:Uncharacterized protein n=1 Tax=Lupinus albus TaxID=3870 RepID=A0A6A4NFU1_LUPAL|nr:hypothetical protein Lalb_Chr20g0112931 [Lupinus albus]
MDAIKLKSWMWIKEIESLHLKLLWYRLRFFSSHELNQGSFFDRCIRVCWYL